MPSLFRPEDYLRPNTVEEAISFLGKNGAKIVAGGTDLLVDKPGEIKCLVDITSLPLSYIKQEDEGLKIGALTTIRKMETSPIFKKSPYTALAEAAHAFGTVAIRNTATVGGNICNALPSADTPPALVALDASVMTSGPLGKRDLPLEKFFLGVRKTALERDELLTEIQIPAPSRHTGTAFLKFGRTSVDLALVNTAVRVTLEGEILKDVRIVVGGGVGPTLVRSRKAEATLIGKKKGEINETTIEKATKEIPEELTPRPTSVRGSGFYKKDLSKVLVKRALLTALDRAKGG